MSNTGATALSNSPARAILFAVAAISGPGLAQVPTPSIGVQRQVDSQSQPILYPRLVETSIAAVSRTSLPDALVANWIYHGSSGAKNGVAASIDGGATWTEHAIAGWKSDPMACADQQSGSLWVGVAHLGGTGTPGIHVAKWNEETNEFNTPVAAVSSIACDKAFMGAGPRRNQPGTTRLYVSFLTINGPHLNLTWSDDLGLTWATPVQLPEPPAPDPPPALPQWGDASLPRVGPDGELYIFTWDGEFGVFLIRSLAENGSEQPVFDAPIRIATRLDTWSSSASEPGLRIPGGFNAAPFTYGAVDPENGTLYCVYFDTSMALCSCCPEVCTAWDVDLYFSKSTNQGTTWTTPQRILGSDHAPYDQFFAWLEVDTSHRLHLVYFDTRGAVHTDQTSPAELRTRYSWSTDAGATWADSTICTIAPYWTVSPPPPTPAVWIADDFWYGEYIGLAATANRVYPIYPASLGPGVDPPDRRIWTNIIISP